MDIYKVSNRELIDHEYNTTTSDLCSELADRLTIALNTMSVLLDNIEDMTDNEYVRDFSTDQMISLTEIRKLTR